MLLTAFFERLEPALASGQLRQALAQVDTAIASCFNSRRVGKAQEATAKGSKTLTRVVYVESDAVVDEGDSADVVLDARHLSRLCEASGKGGVNKGGGPSLSAWHMSLRPHRKELTKVS